MDINIDYIAEPTAARFHRSEKFVRGFRGPVGNGKSVCCIMELIRMAAEQWPNKDGIRKTRYFIVRNTYIELRETTLHSWKQWIPEIIAPVAMNPIITTTFKRGLGDGTSIEMEVVFLAMDRDDDVKKVKSLECTGFFLNEAQYLPYSVPNVARERAGRYPAQVDGYVDVWENDVLTYDAPKVRNQDGSPELDENGDIQYTPCKRKSVIMDTNSPEDDHWWYQLAEDGFLARSGNTEFNRSEVDRIFDFFEGPPALIKNDDGTYSPNPGAENIKHLPGGYQYYLDMLAGNADDYINVMVLGQYGTIVQGRPVYPSYRDEVHCPEGGVKADPNLPLCMGWDFGLTPTVVFGQMTSTGQLRVVDELCSDDMDVRTFARDMVKPHLQQHYANYWIGFSLGDPAGNIRGEGEGKTSIGILNDQYTAEGEFDLDMGFLTEPAPTNDITLRLDAGKRFLNKMVNGEPGMVLDKRCRMVRKALRGGYCYKRMSTPGASEVYRDKPDKNTPFSHPADAKQYLELGFAGGYVVDKPEDDDDWMDEPTVDDVPASGY